MTATNSPPVVSAATENVRNFAQWYLTQESTDKSAENETAIACRAVLTLEEREGLGDIPPLPPWFRPVPGLGALLPMTPAEAPRDTDSPSATDRCTDGCEPCACARMATRPHCQYCMNDLTAEDEARWRAVVAARKAARVLLTPKEESR